MKKELIVKNLKDVKYFNVYETTNGNGYNSLFKYSLDKNKLLRISNGYSISMPEDDRYFDMKLLDNKNGYISLKKEFNKDDPEIINNLYNNVNINNFDNTSIILAVFKYNESLNKLVRISKFFINGYITELNLLSCNNLFIVNILKEIKINSDEYITKLNKAIFQYKDDKFNRISNEFGSELLWYFHNGKSNIINIPTVDNELRQLLQYNKDKNSFDVISDKYNSIDAKLLIDNKSDYFIVSLINNKKSNGYSKSFKRCVMKYDKKSNKSIQISKWFDDCYINIIEKDKKYQVSYKNNTVEIYSINNPDNLIICFKKV